MAHEVMCRLCKKRFDIDTVEGVVIGKLSYYHKTCYEEWKKGKDDAYANMDTDFWYEALVDYLYRDVKVSINFPKLQNQWENFIKPGKNMTPKGIYFAIRYFYDVEKGNSERAQGGIGIVPSIYNKSAQYWVDRENKRAGTLEAIIQQIQAREARPVMKIEQKEQKKNKSKWNLDEVE